MNKKIKEELKNLGVAIFYLFGSKATRQISSLCYIDLGFVFKNFSPDGDTGLTYNRLFELFSKIYPNSKIDLIFLQKAPFNSSILGYKLFQDLIWAGSSLYSGI